jgi:protein-L-isoaspartate(D-aspartate) O-methyltransferase
MDYTEQRRKMVERQLRARGIHDERVLSAMLEIPREEFVPEDVRHLSYCDEPLPIGEDQTISQPYITALMVQCLGLRGDERVLEVGAGCGYHAAILGAVGSSVISLEIVPELADLARENLARLGRAGNIEVIAGDGSFGFPSAAPYDAVSVAAAAPEVPGPLLAQLRDPGRLVIPVGAYRDQDLKLITKEAGRIMSRIVACCRFVPLRGGQGWR